MTKTTPREISDRDIGWFAGIIDGEGSLTFGATKSPGTNRLYYGIHIVNTNKEMLEKCLDIIDYITQEPNKLKLKPKVYKETSFKKTPLACYQVTIRRKESIRKVLEEIIDLLTEKRIQGLRLLNYLQNCPKFHRFEEGEVERILSYMPVETKQEALRKEMKL